MTAAKAELRSIKSMRTREQRKHCSDVAGLPAPSVRRRNDIAAILEQLQLTTGAELGVFQGEFAKHNLQLWPSCKKYVLVD
eukprot:gene48741-29496_t